MTERSSEPVPDDRMVTDYPGVEIAWVGDPHRTRASGVLAALVAETYDVPVAAVHLRHLCPVCGSDRHGRPLVRIGDRRGRPHVRIGDRSGPHVSLARAGATALVAVGDSPLGVDVETVAATRFAGFDAVALHPDERAADATERAVLWVRKEALLKAAGTGLATDPREVHVTAAAREAAVLDWAHGPAWVRDVPATAGLVAALAVLGEVSDPPADPATPARTATSGTARRGLRPAPR